MEGVILTTIFGILFAFHMIYLNLKLVRSVYDYSVDAKSISCILESLRDPGLLNNDFTYRDVKHTAEHYVPFAFKLWRWLHNRLGTVDETFIFLNILFVTLYITGISLFTFTLYGSPWVTMGCLFLAVPWVTILGHWLQGCIPRTYSPRDLGNAITPIFFFFFLLAQENWLYLIAAAGMSGLLFNINPRNGVATTICVLFWTIDHFLTGKLQAFQAIIPILITLAPCFPYSFTYRRIERSMTANSVSDNEIQLCQKVMRLRNYIWPKTYSADSLWGGLWLVKGQLITGIFYLIISGIVFFIYDRSSAQESYVIQTILNLVIMSAFLTRREHFASFVINLAVIGLFSLPVLSPALTLVLLLTNLIALHKGKVAWAFCLFWATLVAFTSFTFINGYPVFKPSDFDIVVSRLTPVLFFIYLSFGSIFHWFIPYVLKRKSGPLQNSAICQVVMMSFWQFYFLAFYSIYLMISTIQYSSLINAFFLILCMISVLLSYAVYYRNYANDLLLEKENPSILNIFKWIKENTSKSATFHVVSNLPYFHADIPGASTFAFQLRAHTLRSVTVCYPDGGGALPYSRLIEWISMMEDIRRSVIEKDVKMMAGHALKYNADYLIISNDLITGENDGHLCFHNDFTKLLDRFAHATGKRIEDFCILFELYTILILTDFKKLNAD